MANPVNLHLITPDFRSLIKETADYFSIREIFIEKDYWITLVLKRLADSEYSDSVVFKGGTSLSKGYKLINRFSEDIDIAIINSSESTGNQIKTLIRNVEKTISVDLKEIDAPGITSKGSQYRKSLFYYPLLDGTDKGTDVSNKIIIEINSFANPYPFISLEIRSMICEFLETSKRSDLIKKYGLDPFNLNILDRKRTLIEKIVSLIRFSFSENPTISISEKIRHFYDIYYLLNDKVTNAYLDSDNFIKDISELIVHDRISFDDPPGWKQKSISQSPILTGFDVLWNNIRTKYTRELSTLAFTEIPNENEIALVFKKVVIRLKDNVQLL